MALLVATDHSSLTALPDDELPAADAALRDALQVLADVRGARDTCVVCLARPRTVVLQPCGHLVVCDACLPHVRGMCPIDRTPIAAVVHVRR